MPYVSQISLFAFPFAPRDWAFCQGQSVPISQNTQLFSILGTLYGGNGSTFFMLPNLPGVPVGAGQGAGLSDYDLGESGGEATVTLLQSEMPAHNHAFNALADPATSADPADHQLARAFVAQATTDNVVNFYSPNPPTTSLSGGAIAPNGGGGPHNNMQPFLALNYCIALKGVYPNRDGKAVAADTPFIGEIGIFAFNQVPQYWLPCDGRPLPINRNQALFSLLGLAFGGDGRTTFALPDLRGRVPLGFAPPSVPIGTMRGEATHHLSVNEMPAHNHTLNADAATASGLGNTPSAATVLGRSFGEVVPGNTPFSANLYNSAAPTAALDTLTIDATGSAEPHQNMMPSMALTFCINANPNGLYPPRS